MKSPLVLIATVISVLIVSGCGGERTGSVGILDRDVVASAFADSGEPLAVRLDMQESDPGSVVDVIFVPANEDVPNAPFEITLFEDIDSAVEHVELLKAVANSSLEIVSRKNAILTLSDEVTGERRSRILSVFNTL